MTRDGHCCSIRGMAISPLLASPTNSKGIDKELIFLLYFVL
ncbi:hypothetical protein DZC18_000575 [Clostridium beijerinckii]|nr:hypothetical protein [Clostridium beijerinckii]